MRVALDQVFDGRTPSFEALAGECDRAATGSAPAPWQALSLRHKATRLRRAARWEPRLAEPFWRYLWHIGILRHGTILGGVLGILALTRTLPAGGRAGSTPLMNVAVLFTGGVLIGAALAA